MTVLLLTLGVAAPVGAHSGQGILTVNSVEPSPDATVAVHVVDIHLAYVGDGHPADDATVTVSGSDPDGDAITPVPMDSQGDGNYVASVPTDAAGVWSLRVVAVEPAAETNLDPITITEADLDESSADADADADEGAVDSADDPSADDPSADADNADAGVEADPVVNGDDDEDGTPMFVWILLGSAVAALAGGAALWARNRSAESRES